MSKLQLHIQDRRGKALTSLSLAADATTDDLKALFEKECQWTPPAPQRRRRVTHTTRRVAHSAFVVVFARPDPRWDVNRQYFTKGSDASKIVLKAGAKLSAQGVANEDTLVFKDLGRQISWKTVFHVEYAGPIIMHALCYYFGALVYGKEVQHSYTQTVAFWCVVGHYLKREYETHFIHRFSNATMPFFNVFKNSAHYWSDERTERSGLVAESAVHLVCDLARSLTRFLLLCCCV